MAKPWDADIGLTRELAARLICTQFPALHGTLEAFGNGWDNTAFLLGGQWVFRFPRRKVVVEFLAGEIRVLPRLAPLLPLAITKPVFIGQPTPEFPYPFAGYRLIAGITADRAGLDDAARLALAAPLADFLRVLHGIPLTVADELGIPFYGLGRLDAAACLPAARDGVAELAQRGDADPAQADALRGILDAAQGCQARVAGIVHGDLYLRHLVVKDGKPSGVIDWGDCHRSDPAMDLGMVFAALPVAARAVFFARYGMIPEATRALARFRAAVALGHLGRFAHDIGDADLIAEVRREVAILSGA